MNDREELAALTKAAEQGRMGRRELLRRAAALGLSAPAIAGLLAACGASSGPSASGAAPSAAGDPNGKITYGLGSDWQTLDPTFYTNVAEREIFYSIYDPLVDMDQKLDIQPRLAKSWDVQDGGKTIVFTLQPNVKFHDGTACDAAAVKFNLERMLDPKTGSPQRTNIDAITSVDAVGATTVRLSLKEPFTPLLGSLTEGPGFVSSPAAIKAGGKDYGLKPVGTGAFTFVEWLKADQIRLKKNPSYWRSGLPKFADLVWKPIPDETVKLANLKSGAIDVIDNVPSSDRKSIRDDPTFATWDAPGTRWPMIRLNLAKPPFNNKLVRQAVSLAVNRADIVKAVYFGEATPALGPISPVYKSYYDASIDKYGLGYDPSKAKEKLTASGATNVAFTVEIQNVASQQRLAEIVKENLAAIGITVTIQPYAITAFQDRITNKLYQATIGSWTPRPDIDGTMYRHFATDGNVNSMHYSNPDVDALFKRSRTLANGPDRVKVYQDVQKLIVDDAPWVFLIFETQTRAWSKKAVSGIPQIPDVMVRFAEVTRY
ncbi:MAG: hypothetical protein KGN00_09755 [Chloroflexota bacterium]|nr:hypothetical protein [Chloroflexota bacterium]MDE3193959.1 hypothetical protein [Chloroflexota bacterium]